MGTRNKIIISAVVWVAIIATGGAFLLRSEAPLAIPSIVDAKLSLNTSPSVASTKPQVISQEKSVALVLGRPSQISTGAGGGSGAMLALPPLAGANAMPTLPSAADVNVTPTLIQPTSVSVASATKQKEDADAGCRQKLLSLGVYLLATDPCVDIDELIKNLANGKYSFNKPSSAYVGEPFTVVLTLQTAEGQDVAGPFQGTTGQVVTQAGRFAQRLEATLRGGIDFTIMPDGAQERIATATSPVVWRWTVTPQRAGKRTLAIDVTADLMLRTEKAPVPIRTLSEEIQINVGYLHMFVSAFSSLWGILGSLAIMTIAILGVVQSVRAVRHRTDAHQPTHEAPPIEVVTHHLSDRSHSGHPHSNA